MSLIAPSRRGFLFGAGALLAAPAIVRASSLMPIKPASQIIGIDLGRSRDVTCYYVIETGEIRCIDFWMDRMQARHASDGIY